METVIFGRESYSIGTINHVITQNAVEHNEIYSLKSKCRSLNKKSLNLNMVLEIFFVNPQSNNHFKIKNT